jgi:hypothetical protein
MDPETCWEEIVKEWADAIAVGRKRPLSPAGTRARVNDLEVWLFKGGFVPKDLHEAAGRPDGTGIVGLDINGTRFYAVVREKAQALIEEAGGPAAWKEDRWWAYQGTKYYKYRNGEEA